MQIISFLSESFLATMGFLTYYFLLKKAPQRQVVLWGTFILSVLITSSFSAIYFAGIEGMNHWHDFFRDIGSTTGIVLLVLGIYSAVVKHNFSAKIFYFIMAIALGFGMICIYLNLSKVIEITPLVGILLVLILGIIALTKGNKMLGMYLLLATIFSVLANIFPLLGLPINPLSAYCFLLSCVLVCFGLAVNSVPHSIS